jgi:ferredoxin-nitrite reductase
MSDEFSPEQKRYLEGFASGVQIARAQAARIKALGGHSTIDDRLESADTRLSDPDGAAFAAQNRVLRSGRKLADQEKFKREQHPFDCYETLKEQAANDAHPSAADNFRWRYFGLFYLAPTLSAYMCRLRIPNGILRNWQFAGLADLAERYGAPYCHVTTRANLQLREIPPKNSVALLEAIQDLGLCSRGAGADNIRNVTGTPTAGVDPQELLDTRPYAREWHFHILNNRALYGLPRKFNVGFDGGGKVAVLEDTNDIGFQAVEVRDGFGVEAGIWFRLLLGGITGHRDFARDTGVLVRPVEATKVADAIVRVFIDHGDRANRTRARLKYLLDAWGFEKFIAEVEERLGRTLQRAPVEAVAPRPAVDRMAHVGVHPQKQPGLSWIGVALPIGKITVGQMRGLAEIAREYGDGDLRLTVWQNLLISGVADEQIDSAVAAIEALGLSTRANSIRAGLVACTGSAGCRFAAAHTKHDADTIASWCEGRLTLDVPVNIHLTGCHNSCAQHLISDIGLLAARVEVTEEETVDGYHIYLGGGFGSNAEIGRELCRDVPAEETPALIERLLRTYLTRRTSPSEGFLSFARRVDLDELRALAVAKAEA